MSTTAFTLTGATLSLSSDQPLRPRPSKRLVTFTSGLSLLVMCDQFYASEPTRQIFLYIRGETVAILPLPLVREIETCFADANQQSFTWENPHAV